MTDGSEPPNLRKEIFEEIEGFLTELMHGFEKDRAQMHAWSACERKIQIAAETTVGLVIKKLRVIRDNPWKPPPKRDAKLPASLEAKHLLEGTAQALGAKER